MKFSICRRPVAPVVAAPPIEIGRSRIALVGITVPISAEVVCSCTSLPDTVTESVTAPSSSTKSAFERVAVLTSTDSRTADRKPVLDIATR